MTSVTILLLAAALIAWGLPSRRRWDRLDHLAPGAAHSTSAAPRRRPGGARRASAPGRQRAPRTPSRRWPHSGSGVPATTTSATRGSCRIARSTGSGHTFSPPLTIRSPRRPSTPRRPVWEPPTEIAGRQPSVGAGIEVSVGSAIGAQQHRAANVDLAVVGETDVDTVERYAVVDDSAAGLRHPVGGHHVGGKVVGHRRTAEDNEAEAGGVDAPERRRHEAHQRGLRRLHGLWVEPGEDREGGSGRQRSGHDGESADVGQRETRQPVVVRASRRAGRSTRCAEAATASWVSTTPLGSPVEPLVAITRASPSSTGRPPGRRCSDPVASRTSVTARAASCADLAGGGSRWSIGKAASPSSHTRMRAVDERRPGGQIEGDELSSHRGEPTVGEIAGLRRARHGAHHARDVVRAVESRRPVVTSRWIVGARPRTLPAAFVPVALGVGCAAGHGPISWWRAALALVVSVALQIGVNYANDYSDGVRGTDERRVGPVRLVASGLAAPAAVKRAAIDQLRRRRRRRVDPRRLDVVVVDRGRCRQHRRSVGVHGRTPAVRVSRARRGVRVRVLRPRRHRGDDLRQRRDDHRVERRDRQCRGVRRLRSARRQQPARHPHRPGGRQAHAGRPSRRSPDEMALRRPPRGGLRSRSLSARRSGARLRSSDSPPRHSPWPRCGACWAVRVVRR